MKRKELKQLAQKIAKAEKEYQEASDLKTKARIEQEIFELSSRIESLEDMETLDDMIQKNFKKLKFNF